MTTINLNDALQQVVDETNAKIGLAEKTAEYAPKPNGNGQAPRVGELAAASIRKYAEELATFIEESAQEQLNQAQSHLEQAKAYAASVREAADIHATNTLAFSIKMQQAGLAQQAARDKFMGEAE